MGIHPLLLLAFLLPAAATNPAGTSQPPLQKTITIHLSGNGDIFIDGVKLRADQELTTELQSRLWRSYVGNGLMPQSIHLETEPGIGAAAINAAHDAIVKTQTLVRDRLAVDKYKQAYKDISTRKQEKIKKKFPVLFQTDF